MPARLFSWTGLMHDLEVGKKLAEGRQAEIYEARLKGEVVKVFKEGSVLQELEKQWPPTLMQWYHGDLGLPSCLLSVFAATLLMDKRLLDRFTFLIPRRWGDLRKLIDHQMVYQSCNQGPPFSPEHVLHLMLRIALDMRSLHEQHPPILHNDLKAANVLVNGSTVEGPAIDEKGVYGLHVADYECLVGVVGTQFWRASEILQQLKDRVPMSKLVFTKQCDVYNYGMTCYELVTGRIPFEDYIGTRFAEGRDLILNGARPELPLDLDPFVESLITRCWHPTPLEWLSFVDICKQLRLSFEDKDNLKFSCTL